MPRATNRAIGDDPVSQWGFQMRAQGRQRSYTPIVSDQHHVDAVRLARDDLPFPKIGGSDAA